MRTHKGIVGAVETVWRDLLAFNPPAVFLSTGVLCVGFLHVWGSSYVAGVMALCTILTYLAGRRLGGWGQLFLGIIFSLFMIAVTLISVVVGFFLYYDFSPNGQENYTRIRRDFFPREIPPTAYDVQVWSRISFGPGVDEAYLSYRDTKENLRRWAEIGRERSEMRSRHAYINAAIRVPNLTVDEQTIEPRFSRLPLWQRAFIDYVPHPTAVGPLKEKFVFYVWDLGNNPNHPQAKIIGISEDGTHVIFYAVGK